MCFNTLCAGVSSLGEWLDARMLLSIIIGIIKVINGRLDDWEAGLQLMSCSCGVQRSPERVFPLFIVSSYNLVIVADVAKLVKSKNKKIIKAGAQRPALNEFISVTRRDGDVLFVRLIHWLKAAVHISPVGRPL